MGKEHQRKPRKQAEMLGTSGVRSKSELTLGLGMLFPVSGLNPPMKTAG